jgi:hypothetical protein
MREILLSGVQDFVGGRLGLSNPLIIMMLNYIKINTLTEMEDQQT